jgi:hypothetical protein
MKKKLNKVSFGRISALIVIAFMGCANSQSDLTQKTGKTIDKKLVGIFKGGNNNDGNGAKNSWVINRNADGTYLQDKTFRMRGRATRIKTNGNWWTENGKYYQQNTNINETEVYTYKVLGTKKITFKSTSTEENYEYSEEKE